MGEDLFLVKDRTSSIFFFILVNLSEDFFFVLFDLQLILGKKTDLVLGWKIFILVFINLFRPKHVFSREKIF